MSKGITPVIAIILLLLITISMVGFAFVFFGRVTSSSGAQIENATQQLVQQGSARFAIEGVNSNKIYLRNLGTAPIQNTGLGIYNNNNLVDYTLAAPIPPGSVGEVTMIPKSCKGYMKGTIKVNAGSFTDSVVTQNNPPDGVYQIKPDAQVISAQCDMTRDCGGWTMIVKSWYQAGVMGNVNAVGTVADAMTRKGNAYKLSDTDIRAIIGQNQKFDILADQNGYNSAYSTGNYEYVILRGYTGYWRFDTRVAASSTATTFQSYRLSDNALAWTGNLQCGSWGGAGINCYNVLSNNPQGGAGCNINMGLQSNPGWHHFYMSETNQDTYLYICNGPQHSSGFDMNHRWWVREA